MRILRLLMVTTAVAWASGAQDLPKSVDLIQRIDQLYPWLNAGSLALDGQGSIYISATIQNGVPAAVTNRIGPLGGQYDMVVVKFDSTAQHILYARAIGGSLGDTGGNLQVDTAGSVYLLNGQTASDDFPATAWVGNRRGSVFLKLDPNGNLVYSMVLGLAELHIFGAQVDAAGAVYFGGAIQPGQLPTSPSAYHPSPQIIGGTGEAFIAKLDSLGTKIEAATYMGNLSPLVQGIKLRRNGSVVFATATASGTPSMIGALDGSLSTLVFSTAVNNARGITLDDGENIYAAELDALKEYSSNGQPIRKIFEFNDQVSFDGFSVTRSGLIYLFLDVPPTFPTRNGTQPCWANLAAPPSFTFTGKSRVLTVIGPDNAVRYATYMVQTAGFIRSPFNDHLYGLATVLENPSHVTWQGIVDANPDELPSAHTSAGCLVHAGTLNLSSIAPGTIMTIFGDGMGPDVGQSFTVADGLVSFDVAGTSVSVDGIRAPVLYAQRGQINFIAPWSLQTQGTRVPICVTVKGDTSCLYGVTDSIAPGFFSVNSQIAAINEDGSINSLDHPAHFGAYVSLYLTGIGHIQGPEIDGGVMGLQPQAATGTLSAVLTFCGVQRPAATGLQFGVDPCFLGSPPKPATVLFAGAVPTLVSGVDVAILRVPSSAMLTTEPASVALEVRSSQERAPYMLTGVIYIAP